MEYGEGHIKLFMKDKETSPLIESAIKKRNAENCQTIKKNIVTTGRDSDRDRDRVGVSERE
jgi:hypothetical protein